MFVHPTIEQHELYVPYIFVIHCILNLFPLFISLYHRRNLETETGNMEKELPKHASCMKKASLNV